MVGADLLIPASGLAVLLAIILLLVLRHYRQRVEELESRLREVTSQKQSLSTTYGRITEQFAPFMASYPHDPRNFRFIGSPVDGIQFEDDRIVFVEIKANSSRLSPAQEKWRRLVEEGRVEWLEFRVQGPGAAPAGAEPPRRYQAAPDERSGSAWDR